MIQGTEGLEHRVKEVNTGSRAPRGETRDKPGDHLSSTPVALLTGIPMGAGQAVSSHLRGWLVATVQELLGVEDMAGVGDAVHAVQNVDLAERGSLVPNPLLQTPFPTALGVSSAVPSPIPTSDGKRDPRKRKKRPKHSNKSTSTMNSLLE